MKGITWKNIVEISAKDNIGIEDMQEKIYSYIVEEDVENSSEKLIITNIRHKTALEKTKDAIRNIFETIDMGLPMDLISVDLKEALDSLSEITGDKTFIQSVGNIENIGGKISGNEAVVLISDNGKVINDTTKRSVGYYNSEFDRTKHEEVKSLGTISSNGTVFVKANSYESTGGMLSTDHLALDVNKVNLNALSLSGEDKFGSGGSNFSRYTETTHLGAGVSANSASGTVGDMNLKGSSFIAKDTTGLTVTGNIKVELVVNKVQGIHIMVRRMIY